MVNEPRDTSSGAIDTEPRPAVVRFAQLMERKLRARDYKGGWENCTLQYLAAGMAEEVSELTGAMDAILTDDGPANLYAVIEEAVDVANYCMMLADVAQAQIRRGKTKEDGAGEGLGDRVVSRREPAVCQEPARGGRNAG